MKYAVLITTLLIAACAHQSGRDGASPPPVQNFPNPGGTEGGSLIYSIFKTASDPAWLRDPAILGVCTVALVKGTQLDTPCQHVVVVAKDKAGKEAAKATLDGGKFRLSVPRNQDFFVTIQAPLYKVDGSERIGPVKAGETIEFRLTKK